MIQYLVEEALRAVAREHDARDREEQHKQTAVQGAQTAAKATVEAFRRARRR